MLRLSRRTVSSFAPLLCPFLRGGRGGRGAARVKTEQLWQAGTGAGQEGAGPRGAEPGSGPCYVSPSAAGSSGQRGSAQAPCGRVGWWRAGGGASASAEPLRGAMAGPGLVAGDVVVDALPYFDQGYEAPGVREAVSEGVRERGRAGGWCCALTPRVL